jgi:cytochrome c biogenesis protein CcdA
MKLIFKKQKNQHLPVSKRKAALKKLFIPALVISIFSILKLTNVIAITWLFLLIPIIEIIVAYVAIYLGGKMIIKRLRNKRKAHIDIQ